MFEPSGTPLDGAKAQEIASQIDPGDTTPSDDDLLKMLEGDATKAPAEKPQSDELNSKKFAELAKMEAKYQRQIREMKEELESAKQGATGKLTRDELLEQLREDYKKNPKAFLEKQLNGSYDQLSDFILNEEDRVKEVESDEKFGTLQEKLDSLQKKLEDKEKAEAESNYNKKVEEFKGNILRYIDSKGEDYGIISALGEQETVYEVIQNYFEEHGKTLDIDEACEQVEKYYLEKVNALSKIEKVRKMFNVDNKPEVNNNDFLEQLKPRVKNETLTNDFVSGYSESDLEEMSDDERFRLAASLL